MPPIRNTTIPERPELRALAPMLTMFFVVLLGFMGFFDSPESLLWSCIVAAGVFIARFPAGWLSRRWKRVGYHWLAWLFGVIGGSLTLLLLGLVMSEDHYSRGFGYGIFVAFSIAVGAMLFATLVELVALAVIPPKPKRLTFRFSLKTLLLAMVAATVIVGWFGLRMQQARQNRIRTGTARMAFRETEAVVEMKKLGAEVHVGYERLRPRTPLERWFSDPGDVDDCTIGDCKINGVDFSDTKVTNPDLNHLKGLPTPFFLFFMNTPVTDAAMKQLKDMPTLSTLDLKMTSITDAGLEHLKGLVGLKYLDLRATKVTRNGVDKLQRALPNCEISHDF